MDDFVAPNGFALGLRSQGNEIDVESLPTEGRFPDWLKGALYRNGPALFEVGEHDLEHWFDGYAMLHRFEFRGDGIGYRNRFVRSESYTNSMREGKLHDMQFDTNVSDSRIKSVIAFWKNGCSVTDNTCVNITPGFPGEMVALTEGKHQQRIDADTLETMGHVKFQDDLSYVIGSAHPHYDFDRRETITYAINFGRKSSYLVYRQPSGSLTRELIASIPFKRSSYMHSFSVTENYAVLIECPFTANPLSFLFSGLPFIKNFKWDMARGTMLYVVDRRNGRVQQFEAAPMFSFHTINAWESGRELFIDLSAYPNADIVNSLRLVNMRSPENLKVGSLRRYRLNLDRGTVHEEDIFTDGIDLPGINYRQHNAHPYRYAFGISNGGPHSVFDRLVKVDTESGKAQTWKEDHCYPTEPVLATKPGATREDQGVILSVTLDAKAEKSFLLAVDAESFEELGRAQLPQVAPYGFHGIYLHKAST